MIGRLRGTLLARQAPSLVLDVNGVGYEIDAPMTTFYELPPVGKEITLYTHLVVRDDAHLLYGFASERERRLFRQLIKVSGVGAKLALTILSGVAADVFVACVLNKDTATLTRLPGVGKKTAERLVVEMRDRLEGWGEEPGGDAVSTGAAADITPLGDAVSALVALGYKPNEASRMVRVVDAGGLSSEEIIRRALQSAVK
jgi:Holliday junction DNA helicase RuvA